MSRNILDALAKEVYNVRDARRIDPSATFSSTQLIKAGSSRGPFTLITYSSAKEQWITRVTIGAHFTTPNIIRVRVRGDPSQELYLAGGVEQSVVSYDFDKKPVRISQDVVMDIYVGNTTGGWWMVDVQTLEWIV